MGTRHLIAVMVGGKYKVAQYGQWDGYPTGQGMTVLAFLRDPANVVALRAKAPLTRWLTEADGEVLIADQPHMSRDTGAEILAAVASSPPGLLLIDKSAFAGDSLFCEWAYVVDLDANRLEIFRGFNKQPLSESERFASAPRGDTGVYYPVRFVASWPLDAVPDDAEMEWLEGLVREREEAAE